ncbi:MAG: signal peptidase I [Clostridiales bacterium]|nr:signal peptidase I [Clostridiales bacterium]
MIGRRKKNEADLTDGPAEEQKLPFGYEAYTWLHDVVSCLAVVMVLFVFFLRLIGVSGPSMTPTLLNGDRVILLSNFLYREVDAGDIVVMQIPSFDTEPIVKRVIATGGQTVDIDFEAGEVYVDGVLLQEDYINELTHLSYVDGPTFPVTVPDGCLFVMGDNRNDSADSRYGPIGMVDARRVLGRVMTIVWPAARFGMVS